MLEFYQSIINVWQWFAELCEDIVFGIFQDTSLSKRNKLSLLLPLLLALRHLNMFQFHIRFVYCFQNFISICSAQDPVSPSNAAGEALAAHAKEAVVPSISTWVVQDVGACPKSLNVTWFIEQQEQQQQRRPQQQQQQQQQQQRNLASYVII